MVGDIWRTNSHRNQERRRRWELNRWRIKRGDRPWPKGHKFLTWRPSMGQSSHSLWLQEGTRTERDSAIGCCDRTSQSIRGCLRYINHYFQARSIKIWCLNLLPSPITTTDKARFWTETIAKLQRELKPICWETSLYILRENQRQQILPIYSPTWRAKHDRSDSHRSKQRG